MALRQDDSDLIRKYLLEKLDTAEHKRFKERQTDPDFRKELRWLQSIKRPAIDIGRNRLRASFDQWDKETVKEGRIPTTVRWSLIAASVLVLVCLGYFIFFPSNTTKTLFTKYYTTYPNLVDPITKGPEGDESLTRLYEQGKYAQMVKLTPNSVAEEFYQGLGHLALGNFDQAIKLLSKVTQSNSHGFSDAPRWYLGLGLVRKRDLAAAREALALVAEGKGDHSDRAKELLQQLP